MSEQPVAVSEPKNALEAARARSNQQTVAVNGRGSTTAGCSGDEQYEERTKDGEGERVPTMRERCSFRILPRDRQRETRSLSTKGASVEPVESWVDENEKSLCVNTEPTR
ncbi:hypothetical protein PC113_g19688 [Phytophthora cactorum]|uniref:Uncharacterized protein n=1 Tax=Phytophthora cactorum TaxID=29920 RepID=A0A8T1AZM8_9STRA|nr:hypothetical protein PC111_g19203 [Phytophthora cactorum]KAG2838281.1 hypothetical protein PC113_g19688 [Phytophthora cactorum]KAG2890783.1 hypothetical protein PC115_g19404 [Phytophthora cactorum]KAG3134252.1 hypothetical protein C6341_g22236 [Phytophthora cactorum]